MNPGYAGPGCCPNQGCQGYGGNGVGFIWIILIIFILFFCFCGNNWNRGFC